MYTSILVPTDGSPSAETAARHALTLAKHAGSNVTIHALGVLDTRIAHEAVFSDDMPRTEEIETAEERLHTAVDHVADLGAEMDQVVKATVEHGVPHETIRHYADDADCDLIVMGTHGWTELSRMLIGSVTEKIVRSIDIPVLTVHPEEERSNSDLKYDRIVTPTDGSAGAEIALSHALDIGTAFDSTLDILSVVDSGILSVDFEGGYEAGEMLNYLEESAETYVEEAKNKGETREVEVRGHVETGNPSREISEFAKRNDTDLIVMGTHGRTGLARFLIGSVTERVIRRSSVPVLVVRPPRDRA